MATSTNPKIQALMDEINALDNNDTALEDKLQKIAAAVAAEQQKTRPATSLAASIPVDPQDDFQCDACQ
jgi:hypothetical protein